MDQTLLEAAAKQVADLKATITKLNEEVRTRRLSQEALADQANALTNENEELIKQSGKLKAEIESLRSYCKGYVDTIKTQITHLNNLHREKTAFSLDVSRLSSKVSELVNRNNELTATLIDAVKTREEYKARGDKAKNFETALEKKEVECWNAVRDLHDAKQRIIVLSNDLTSVSAARDRFMKLASNRAEDLAKLQKELASATDFDAAAEIGRLREEIGRITEAKRKQIYFLNGELDALRKLGNGQATVIKALREDKKELNQQLFLKIAAISDMAHKHEQETRKLKGSLELAEVEYQKLRRAVDITEMKKGYPVYTCTLDDGDRIALQLIIDEQKTGLKVMKEELKSKIAERDKQKAENNELKSSIDSMKLLLTKHQETIDRLKAENSELKSSVENLKLSNAVLVEKLGGAPSKPSMFRPNHITWSNWAPPRSLDDAKATGKLQEMRREMQKQISGIESAINVANHHLRLAKDHLK